jgi:hypothetical protein
MLPPESWDHLCTAIKSLWGLDSHKCQIKVYRGVSHALYEITQGLTVMFPHKQGVGHIEHMSPYFEPLMVGFSRLGYQIHTTPSTALHDPAAWVAALVKDTVFVLWSDDDPLTGQLYPSAPLREQLKDKRIFQIRVSHSSHLRPTPKAPGPYDIEVCSVTPDLCVAITGERARFVDAVTPQMPWRTQEILALLKNQKPLVEDAAKVQVFETDARTGFTPLLTKPERLYDRAVLFARDVDGFSVISELAKALKIEIGEPGGESLLETTSLCRWNTLNGLKWFSDQGREPEIVRGLVIIDQSLLSDRLAIQLGQIHQQLLKLQSG